MDLIAIAAPFFLLAILIELLIDRIRGRSLYRTTDAINSISLGIFSTTTGYFTRWIPGLIWWSALQNFAVFDMSIEWFDTSLRGLGLWLLALVLWDLCYYWFHRFSHEVAILWAAHAVHHQSEDYNLSTALRQTSTGFIFGWIFYLPVFLLGFPFEVLMTVSAINLIYQFWVHTQVIHRMGPLDYILVTPSNHRVHHAQNERYIDRNYGGMLIVWDRIFGTFVDETDDEQIVFGVRKPLASWNPIKANLDVYGGLFSDALRTQRWRDKLSVWVRRTGWRPADVQASNPQFPIPLDRFVKYDPPASSWVRAYIVVQFVWALFVALLVAHLFTRHGGAAVLGLCLSLWLQLYSIGLFSDGKSHAQGFELLRLVVVNAVLFLWLIRAEVLGESHHWLVVGTYTLVSLGLLLILRRRQLPVKKVHDSQPSCL